MTGVETVSKLINEPANDAQLKRALAESETKAILLVVDSSQGTKGAGEFLPEVDRLSEENAPVVVIVTRATPGAADNISALMARYRGDNPKAGTPAKKWFW